MRMHSKTARMFRLRSVSFLAVLPIPSTYWAHWSTLTTESKYWRMELENADPDLFRACGSLSKAKVLTAKLKATISTDIWSAICKLWRAWKQSGLQKRDFPTKCCGAASDKMLSGWLLFVLLSVISLLIVLKSTFNRVFPFVFSEQKLGLREWKEVFLWSYNNFALELVID